MATHDRPRPRRCDQREIVNSLFLKTYTKGLALWHASPFAHLCCRLQKKETKPQPRCCQLTLFQLLTMAGRWGCMHNTHIINHKEIFSIYPPGIILAPSSHHPRIILAYGPTKCGGGSMKDSLWTIGNKRRYVAHLDYASFCLTASRI